MAFRVVSRVTTSLSSCSKNKLSLLGGSRLLSASADNLKYLKFEKVGAKKNVGLITFNRPKALNSLCDGLMKEMKNLLDDAVAENAIKCLVITGGQKIFAAGADISEMAPRTFAETYSKDMFEEWSVLSKCSLPIIAAVNGYALGGGCEVAMMCDIIYAGEKAQFGQPEITIGTIPGGGGSQRLIRSVGKSKAMEMVLTGRRISAQEALVCGLVAQVFPADKLIEEAVKVAEKISEHSKFATKMCKEATNAAYEMTLAEGLKFERRLFHASFASHDQKEGMNAFLEKRTPEFKDC